MSTVEFRLTKLINRLNNFIKKYALLLTSVATQLRHVSQKILLPNDKDIKTDFIKCETNAFVWFSASKIVNENSLLATT